MLIMKMYPVSEYVYQDDIDQNTNFTIYNSKGLTASFAVIGICPVWRILI